MVEKKLNSKTTRRGKAKPVRAARPQRVAAPKKLPDAHASDDLTEREREVLALMIEGLNNTQIAGRLTVSPSTVKSHISNILSKLGVASRTEAATLALRTGIALPPVVT